MKQRVAIARSIIHDPRLLILDEPSVGLDPEWQKVIRNMLLNLNKDKKTTILLCSHNLSEIERLCNKIAIINKGEIKKKGNIKEILNNCESHVIFTIEDPAKTESAIKLIHSKFGYNVIPEDKNKIKIIGKEISIPELSITLYQHGINIIGSKEYLVTLEDIYLNVIR
jgi:ABC-2 type transport system ATP-binding protein